MTDDRADADARANRLAWDRDADDYQEQHRASLGGDRRAAWGIWRIPEEDLGVLGDVAGKDVLELGCGAAQWSAALAETGARVTGLDNSGRQLAHASALLEEAGADVPLVQAQSERLPFVDAAFDIVFCDYGALTFTDPRIAVPEAARVLRAGGLLAFTTTSPWFFVCFLEEADEVTKVLARPYFGMLRDEWEGYVDYNVPYGDWIRIFRRAGLIVEDLIEPRPEADVVTTYGGRPTWWTRRWPAENLWVLRRI